MQKYEKWKDIVELGIKNNENNMKNKQLSSLPDSLSSRFQYILVVTTASEQTKHYEWAVQELNQSPTQSARSQIPHTKERVWPFPHDHTTL